MSNKNQFQSTMREKTVDTLDIFSRQYYKIIVIGKSDQRK